ncbi:MAG: antitoxin [Chloroflexi bacterium]|nr:antitoxin [Chloroflexota bacterium]
MRRRLRLILHEYTIRALPGIARRKRVTIAEWVRRALRRASGSRQWTVDAKLRAIARASRHEFPTADVEDMLREIEPR